MKLVVSMGLASALLVSYPANLRLQICKTECSLPDVNGTLEACSGRCEEEHARRVAECEAGGSAPLDSLPMCSVLGDRGSVKIPTPAQTEQLGECYGGCSGTTANVCSLRCVWQMEKSMLNCSDNRDELGPGVCDLDRLAREE